MTRFTPLWLQSGSYAASVDRRLIGALWPAGATSGLAVTVSSLMTLNIAAGQAAVPTQNGSGSTLCSSDNVEQVTLSQAPGTGLSRIDLVIVRPRGTDLDNGSNNDFIFDHVDGVPAASPAVPATPVGTVALALVAVGPTVVSIVPANITDVRPSGLSIPPTAGPGSTPRGLLVYANGPAATTDCGAAGTTVVTSPSFNVVAGRRYRVGTYINASQVSAVGSNSSTINSSGPLQNASPNAWINYNLSAAVGVVILASPTFIFNATGTGPATVFIRGTTSSGAFRFGPNAASVYVEDIGSS